MWMDIGIVALLLFGVYAFTVLVGWERRSLTRRTMRRAEDMYSATSPRRTRPPGRNALGLLSGPGGRIGS